MEAKTQTLRFLWANSIDKVEGMYNLGVAVLSEHLRKVAKFMLGDTRSYSRRDHETEQQAYFRESLAFVEGTGLDMVIMTYGIDVDSTHLREVFFEWIETQNGHKPKS